MISWEVVVDMGPTEALADFVANVKYENIPEEIVHQAKRCVLDTVGCILLGSNTEIGKVFFRIIKDFGGKTESTVLGFNHKTTCLHAALANSTLAETMELDDGVRYAGLHPGCVVIPAALAVSERQKASGKDFVTAVILGYDVTTRIGAAFHPNHTLRGHVPTSTCGTFGAAAAASKLLGLDCEETVNALGIAGMWTPISTKASFYGYTTKPAHSGVSAQTGILAALSAEKGLTGSRSVLEGTWGFFEIASTECNLARVTERLSTRYEIMEVYFKPYPSCRHTHAPGQAAVELAKKHNVRPKDVEIITVKTYESAARIVGRYPESSSNYLWCQFSIPYVVAVAIADRQLSINQFAGEKIADTYVQGLARKVNVVVDPELNRIYPGKTASIVEIETKSGEKYIGRVDFPKGDPRSPLSDKELEEKFRALTLHILKEKQVERTLEMIWNLEKVGEITALVDGLE